MGRPRLAKHPEPTPAPEPAAPPAKEETPASSVSKAEAVRQAMGEGLDSLDDIEGFLMSRFGIEMPRQMISSYKAQQKARDQKAAGSTASPKRGRKPKTVDAPASTSDSAPPTRTRVTPRADGDLLDALKSLKGLVSAHGVAKVKEMVDLLG
jgi:hypothetical protein